MINEVLSKIQVELVAPKNQYNNFGKYKYRSCEDILEGLKPLLKEHGATVMLSDHMQEVGGRVYVVATATLTVGEEKEWVTAYAREAEDKKGMDAAQVTGAASSYARKYALNGLFAIDDTKDADSVNVGKVATKPKATPKQPAKSNSEPVSTPSSRRDELKKDVSDILKKRGMKLQDMKPYLDKKYKTAVATNSEQSWQLILKEEMKTMNG